jgi:uncharacterized protein
MLSFDIRSLEAEAVHVDDVLTADDPIWEDGDRVPASAVHVTGRLSPAGEGRFYFSGQLEGEVTDDCRRCLTDVEMPVSEAAHFLLAEAGDEEVDDPDVYEYPSRAQRLDLRVAIREHWLLSAPQYALCKADCKGLCPTCGADLNAGACDCAPPTDPRFDALRAVQHDDAR